MSEYPNIYDTVNSPTATGCRYLFISHGETNIIKAVQYVYVFDYKGKRVYNLGFGDYDLQTDTISDDLTSNNGDTYRVFYTVLSTIPHFFSTFKNAMMLVRGSDSKKEFPEICRLSCKKKCLPGLCKNAHRRIIIYRNYVDKNFTMLSKEYKFYNGSINDENQLTVATYTKGRFFKGILLKKIG